MSSNVLVAISICALFLLAVIDRIIIAYETKQRKELLETVIPPSPTSSKPVGSEWPTQKKD